MTKLNYSNRKSTGDKLGHIVAKDIRKLLPSSINKSGSHRKKSALEIIIPGKDLTDTGLKEVALALQDVLEEVAGGPAASLEELIISDNVLTTRSLSYLAPVIELAAFHLRDIDLSNNKISVTDDQSAAEWELFLSSFRNCSALRRLDMSRNDLSGPLAFELFSKVYGCQSPVNPADLPSDEGLRYDHESSLESRSSALSIAEPVNDDSRESLLAKATMFKRRQGLRAVPYIIVNQTNMTDSGALFLSYVLTEHYYPLHLDIQGKPGPFESQLEEYGENKSCSGLMYLPNDSLSSSGERILCLAEDIRRQTLHSEADSLIPEETSSFLRRTSGQPKSFRRSSDQGQFGELRGSTAADLESMRRKLQRTEIEQNGVHGVQLWKAAIRLLVLARKFCGQSRSRSRLTTRPGATRIAGNRLTAFGARLTRPVRDRWEYYPQVKTLESCPFGLPDDLWEPIVADGAGASGKLSQHQIKTVMRWAGDKNNLKSEGQMLGKDVSTQIWTVLHDMGCLVYSQVV
ncbi:hypothetical protein EJ05DRAFT_504601 [Pseudovirgaria hyperparasitica]|uniref:Leucine rich repeat protein n=1 Tax=Pseudovirgaria hyperparasitica TaxID=470096 RepID=A0A6A6VXK6_9PEZI|nr:uncharacterized protein EJ05DRAFT_504601 [Pseudovirgaria hyperparasitica]KAF2753997.1 hypothetical protein EJ05DRAFT_504601 [Pseudovirgaria hyperparasitica]